MFKFYFDRRILVGFLLALAILSWLATSSFINTRNFIRSSHMVAHTFDVLYNTERVMSIVTNIELGQRGYSLTGNREFLGPYEKAKDEIDAFLEDLQSLTRDNAAQQQRVDKLRRFVQELVRFSSAAVDLRAKSFDAARDRNASMEGKHLMDSIRFLVRSIEDEEKALVKVRNHSQQQQVQKFNTTFISLLLATGVLLIAIFLAMNITLRARVISEARLVQAGAEIKDLYDHAPCGYHSLDGDGTFVNINNTLLKWLNYEREEVLGKMKFTDIIPEREFPAFHEGFTSVKEKGEAFNLEFTFVRKDGSELPVILNAVALRDEAGNFVKSRATTFDNRERKLAEEKIKNLNHELEAFTYSVSHDLRAPLRSIDGYSKILQEDYLEKFDDEGKRVIRVIMNNAKRMGKLIDDLLDFARVGRKEILRANLNMTQMVTNIVHELLEQEPQRKIFVKVDPLATAAVDPDMMRQVWENLISNAIKYTGKTQNPSIRVSSKETATEVQYCVQDNGVGFDMQYVSKLFGVFQRLHKIQDFGGTGVGLAIVKRIIDRHQGKVWAEGKVNQGATFYFTIPK